MFTRMAASPCLAYMQMTPEQLDKLHVRLQHWTFVIRRHCLVTIGAPAPASAAEQPAALRRALQTLGYVRWRREPGSQNKPLNVQLCCWGLTPALIAELRALPSVGFPTCVTFHDCSWVSLDPCECRSLPTLIPTCYSFWYLHGYRNTGRQQYTSQHLVALCQGMSARGAGCERVLLVPEHCAGQLSEADRSLVEQCVDEGNLGRWMEEIQWLYLDRSV